MPAVDAVARETRNVVFDVLLSIAWADGQLSEEEAAAARGAATALGLRETSIDRASMRPVKDLYLANIAPREGEIIYTCAAWMALADRIEDPRETAVLEELRTKLKIGAERSKVLAARAKQLRRETPPTVSWWREFETLVVAAARLVAAN